MIVRVFRTLESAGPPATRIWPVALLVTVLFSVNLDAVHVTAQDDDTDSANEEESEQKLPKLEEMTLPTAKELLQKTPLDWIVLKDGTVLATKPVQPRPNTLEVMKQRLDESLSWPVPKPQRRRDEGEGAFRDRSRTLLEDYRRRREALRYLQLKLPDDVVLSEEQEESTFRLHIEEHVREVIHHEELMLRRIDKLLNEGNLRQSFELLLVLRRRAHDWPGGEARHNRYLFVSAAEKQKSDQPYDAFVMLSQLYRRAPKYPQLHACIGDVAGGLISNYVDAKNYRRARYYLSRLRATAPQHEVAIDWRNRLTTQTNELLDQSAAATREGRHADATALAAEASRIWPLVPNMRRVYSQAASRFQVLAVGIVDPNEKRMPLGFPTEYSERYQRLTQIDLFEVSRSDDESAHYFSRVFEEWTPTDLGRQAIFQLQSNRQSWESHPNITSAQIAACLRSRIDPKSEQYDERIAGFIDSISTRSPFELSINFSSVPIRTEPLFRFPVTVEDDDAEAGLMDAFELVSQRFQLVGSKSKSRTFRRAVPQSGSVVQRYVAQVVERKYVSHEKAIQGLLRGEVSMLPRIPAWTVEKFAEDERFLIRDYALPTTHVLQFHPQSQIMKSREMRRALAYALNRDTVLSETILRDPNSKRGRLVCAPFATRNYAYNQHVPTRKHDLRLAIALSMVARSAFNKELPKLRMVCEPDPIVQAAADELISHWKRIGVDVTLITDGVGDEQNNGAPWDIAYRTIRMAEPVFELWPFLTLEPTARIAALAHLPDWLRHELIELEKSGDWESVVRHLNRLHLQLFESVQLIPLWEIDDVFVVRKNIQGVPEKCIHPYQDIERWIVNAWYPTDSL